MNRCKKIINNGPQVAQPDICESCRPGTARKRGVLRGVPAKTILPAGAGQPALTNRPPPGAIAPAPSPPEGRGETKPESDIVQRVTELLWLASGRNYLTFEEVHETYPGKFTTDDLVAICRLLAQAGVALAEASSVRGESTPRTPENESVERQTRNVDVQHFLRQMGGPHPLPKAVDADPLKQLEAAEHEMRQIIHGFGFAARQHIVRAGKLLAGPSAGRLEQVVAGSKIRSRAQYLEALPDLIKRVRAMDQRMAILYRELRQAHGRINGATGRMEVLKLKHRLQTELPKFCYQVTVIRQMIAIADNLAAQFRASQRVHEQLQQGRLSVVQLPLADVERQAIETMEEFVRMPCEAFLRNCARLKMAETKFIQARCELIYNHLPLVVSIARTYDNRSLPLPRLIREGITGLLRAVEKYGYRSSWRFSTYAVSWVRQSLRELLAAPSRTQSPKGSVLEK